MSPPVIVGIDEAGRGPLAGPVVAGACVLMDALITHPLIRDSKQLSPQQRDEAFAWIDANCVFGFGVSDAAMIDGQGILAATEHAMQQAVAMIERIIRPTYLIVDGRDRFWFDYPHSSVIDGDAKEPCIAAASIVAKVTRDRMMPAFDAQYPGYNFSGHKGYGSPEHIAAIRALGPCPLHRSSFLRNITSASAGPTQAALRQTGTPEPSAAGRV